MNPSLNEPTANPPATSTAPAGPLPLPVIKKMRWPFPIIWIVPLAAAGLAGYFYYQHHREAGVEITIVFPDGSGIIAGQTLVQVHGVPVGRVQMVVLGQDHAHAVATVRLAMDAQFLARAQTLFWLVRPELSLENITGLSTLITGPYIEASPGEGPVATSFNGLLEPPKAQGPGMKVILHAERLGQVTLESPVTYLGIQVGVVQEVSLSDDAATADVTLFIWGRYAPLVRANSVFWSVKGADLKGGLFSGVKLKLDSLRSILTGGVAFATPVKDTGPRAPDGAQFFLNEQPADDWLNWRPRIALSPAAPSPAVGPAAPIAGHTALPTPKRE